jgi:hypothetical protein
VDTRPPPTGWWQASDGEWYPPELRPWRASDGNWYPPETHPSNAGQERHLRKLRQNRSVQPPEGMGLVPRTNRFRPLVPDPTVRHLVRYLLVCMALSLTGAVLVGVVWNMRMVGCTGRRKRDWFMLLVPVWGQIVVVQTVWRYTAKNVYWSARVDRPSRSLFARK